MEEKQEAAVAVVVSARISWENREIEEVLWQFFDEGLSDDPLETAGKVVEEWIAWGDFPGFEHKVIGNDAAIRRHRMSTLKALRL